MVTALQNQLETGQISHAYLFCGTRGTGKTSAAKIFARAVNCTSSEDGGPCNICETCQSILAERCMDVVEIDAASNNSVDNIRDLREEVRYPPTQCTHKVYIIDEVHMLSTSAFNALLKTLEEPPSHVIFILATTDPQKIPATILSRCQRYDFKRITAADMTATMKRYLEDTSYEDAALEQIAYHSDGAMRDALSLLDQCLAMGEDASVTLANVLKLLGAVDRQVLFTFTDALAAYDSAQILRIIDSAMIEGRDVAQLTNDLVRHFRDVLVAGQGATLDYSAEIVDKLKKQGKQLPADKLIEYIRAFSETLRELRFAPHMRTALEVCALRLCSPEMAAEAPTRQGDQTHQLYASNIQVQPSTDELEGLVSRLTNLEKQMANLVTGPRAGVDQSSIQSAIQTTEEEIPPISTNAEPHFIQPSNTPTSIDSTPAANHASQNNVSSAAASNHIPPATTLPTQSDSPRTGNLTPQLLSEIKTNWRNLCNTLPPMLRSMLIRCGQEANGGTLEIICDNESETKILKDKNRPMAIREALAEHFNLSTPPNLAFIVRETYNNNEPKPPMPARTETPEPSKAPPPPQYNPEPEQMGWDDYAQGVDDNEAIPFS